MTAPNDIRRILGRDRDLFFADIAQAEAAISDAVKGARILVYGGAGSIGRHVVRELFARKPAALDVIDLSENGLAELVRWLRSSPVGGTSDVRFLPIDMAGLEAEAFRRSERPYDLVINLAAMKHVRSEKDAFSLMRMIKVNVLDTLTTLNAARADNARKYFAVSTDKAANPANLMGATKRIMEDVLFAAARPTTVSTARFANVAFSDGSLLHGFTQRLAARQPLAGPSDTRRYFVTGPEAGYFCLLSIALAAHTEILIPKLDRGLDLMDFPSIADRYLADQGYVAEFVTSEEEARTRVDELVALGRWPCYFAPSDTAGEKPEEEFHLPTDQVDWDRFADVAVVRAPVTGSAEEARLEQFLNTVETWRRRGNWKLSSLRSAIVEACPTLDHLESERSLDAKM